MDFHLIKNILAQDHIPLSHEWKGAVLFLCNEDYVFLIKRSENMPSHPGQVAFLGGHKTMHEFDAWTAVKREYEEETKLSRRTIEFIGYLPMVMTAHQQSIIPVLAKLNISTQRFLEDVRSNGEWDSLMAYPWKELSNEEKWEYAWRNGLSKSPVLFHTLRAGTFLSTNILQEPPLLWGATAGIIWDFLRLYFKT